jgi:hypothetical protein
MKMERKRTLASTLCGAGLCVSTLLLLPLVLHAQETRGRITGQVLDTTKAPVPGASVSVTDAARGTTLTSTTNGEGLFQVNYLLPGTYQVTVEVTGFKKYVQDKLQLQISETRDLPIVLEVGGLEEMVSVTFEGAALAGSADLVLEKDGRPAIVDLKLAKPKYFREKLEKGEGLQISLYAALARGDGRGPLPPAGYFMINQGELFTVDRDAFPGARELDGPSMEDTLASARDALAFWRKALAAGVVASRQEDLRENAELEVGEATGARAPAAGPGGIDPPCRFCEYDAICGVTLREVSR